MEFHFTLRLHQPGTGNRVGIPPVSTQFGCQADRQLIQLVNAFQRRAPGKVFQGETPLLVQDLPLQAVVRLKPFICPPQVRVIGLDGHVVLPWLKVLVPPFHPLPIQNEHDTWRG